MIKKNQRILNIFNVAVDWLIILASYLIACWFWLDLVQDDSYNMATITGFSNSIAIAAIIYSSALVFILAVFGSYKPIRRRRLKQDISIVILANTIGLVIVGSILYLLRLQEFSRGVLTTFFVLGTLLLCAKRFVLHAILSSMRKNGLNQKHVILIGTGELAKQYAQNIKEVTEFGYKIDGCIGKKRLDGTMPDPYLGDFDRLDVLLRKPGIDEAIIALEHNDLVDITHIISICENNGTKVSV